MGPSDCFTTQLLAARHGETTPRLSHESWSNKLENSLRSAIELASELGAEVRGSAASKETVRALYTRICSMHERHREACVQPNPPVEAKVLAVTLQAAHEKTKAWYLESLGDPHDFVSSCKLAPTAYNFSAPREAPTPKSVSELEAELRALLNRNLLAAAQPYTDQFNSAFKPYQQFGTVALPSFMSNEHG